MSRQPWPARRYWLVLTVAVAVGAALTTINVFSWGPPQWTNLVSGSREGILLPVILASIGAALLGRAFGRDSVVAGRAAADGSRTVSSQAVLLASSITIGYLVGLVPAIVALVAGASGGRFDALSLAANAAVVVALPLISYLASAVSPAGWGLILGPMAAVYLGIVPGLMNPLLGPAGKSTRQSSAMWFNEFPFAGWHVTPQTSLYRLILFALVAILSTVVTQYVVTGGISRSKTQVVSGFVVVSVMVVASTVISPKLVEYDGTPLKCSGSAASEVCLLPEYETLAPMILEQSDAAIAVVGASAGGFRIVQSTASEIELEVDDVPLTFGGVESDEDLRRRVGGSIAIRLSGTPGCSARFGTRQFMDRNEEERFSVDAQRALDYTIQRRIGLEADSNQVDEATGSPVLTEEQTKLESLDEQGFRDWYAENQQAISSCSLSRNDLP
ncbi:MAG: hypothetical protein WAS54_04105 [Scrofimicrobium sp.]